MLRESAQGRQKRPNKQYPPPRVSHTAKREPGSSRPDQAVQISHRPPSYSTGRRIEPVAPSLRPKSRPEVARQGGEPQNRLLAAKRKSGKKIPNPSGPASVPAEIKSSSANLHPQPTPPSSVSAWGRCPGIPLSLAPTVCPGAEQPEPRRQEAPLLGWTPGRARTFRSTFRQLVQSR